MDIGNPYDLVEIPLIQLIRNLALGMIMAVIWAVVVQRSTRLIVDTSQYLIIFLLLIPAMILIISVIRSSLALSLGLVGALSIVRFRTPIKEPEELLYIFIAIAIGLGLGANQPVATILGFVVICATTWVTMRYKTQNDGGASYYIDLVIDSGERPFKISDVMGIFERNHFDVKVKRAVDNKTQHEVTLLAATLDFNTYETVKQQLQDEYETVSCSLVDNSRLIT